jgi:hypothetical protein
MRSCFFVQLRSDVMEVRYSFTVLARETAGPPYLK